MKMESQEVEYDEMNQMHENIVEKRMHAISSTSQTCPNIVLPNEKEMIQNSILKNIHYMYENLFDSFNTLSPNVLEKETPR